MLQQDVWFVEVLASILELPSMQVHEDRVALGDSTTVLIASSVTGDMSTGLLTHRRHEDVQVQTVLVLAKVGWRREARIRLWTRDAIVCRIVVREPSGHGLRLLWTRKREGYAWQQERRSKS